MKSEDYRLEVLRLYEILDTAAESNFDNFTELASLICETPISLVSIISKDRQWFKSNKGLAADETPRSISFCGKAIEQDKPFIIEDALADPRFEHNPLVTGAPNIRFYAGIPLTVEEGVTLGTLCVIDTVPRKLEGHQLEALKRLGQGVTDLMELRRKAHMLKKLSALFPICSWCNSVLTADAEWVSMNSYLSDNMPSTHGVCPTCLDRELELLDNEV